ncbi:hypothetical protein L6452_08615 [Arctium lappa]|uniref:Uncharacterized protein n=1 Tax=Arctium lappa TaxID=4217 RepID=A0ACB9DI78_ARCLA|nr:hypothetical protein L6452_08615 [Arctium lappa]
MMENLKKVAEEKNLFDMIVKVVVVEKTDPIVIQQSVADFLGIDLKESDKGARAIETIEDHEAQSIETIASFLKCYRNDKWVWENTLSSLKNKEVEEVVYKIFEISYNHLQNEEIRSTLLLCGVFPEDFDTPREDLVRKFKFPNLSLLKLMHGDESLKFPEDFYGEMEKLQVIAYDIMEYPLLSRWLCSTNLRTLCLHGCLLMSDCSHISDLLNLEELSFAHCRLRKFPSTVRNLKELKLLDLTGCVDLIIDDGVLKNLIKLEELYVKVVSASGGKNSIRFKDSICVELAELSKNLFALEIEFFDNNALQRNMSFNKLERFKISLGCYLDDDDDDGQNRHSYENTLMLVTDKCELLDSRMNELLEKTEVLHLQVNDVNNLGDGLVESLHHQ